MSIELVNMDKKAPEEKPTEEYNYRLIWWLFSVIEHSTQEVGTNDNLPRIYSRYIFNYYYYILVQVVMRIPMWVLRNFMIEFLIGRDTYGSYSGQGMYGNHASLNYVFGHLGGNTKGNSVLSIFFLLINSLKLLNFVMIIRV